MSNKRQQLPAAEGYSQTASAQSEDLDDFNLNVGDEDEQVLAYLKFGMSGDRNEMEAWLGKIIAMKVDGSY